MAFTINQEKAISLKNKNILVSAAAGSGKTSVLVERIIRKITDDTNPVSIDRLLIMTFTNAAAKEMRDRIREAIDKKLDDDPDNENLINQSVLIHNATITTIHGFCQSIIRDHFEEIGIDPNFRVGDENECKLIRNDALDKVLEAFYEEGDEEFLETVECFTSAKSDKAFAELVLKLYLFSQSSPNPEKYLEECIDNYRYNSIEEFKTCDFLLIYLNDSRNKIRKLLAMAEEALERVEENPQIAKLQATIEADIDVLEALIEADGYDELRNKINNCSFVRMASVQDKTLDDEGRSDKAFVSDRRVIYKKAVEKLKGDYALSLTRVYENMIESADRIKVLVKVIAAFKAEYQSQKSDKGIIDFNDMEHMAISILSGNDEIAASYREQFEEIYVDEYQDSNMTQETLLERICRQDRGNLFMVGDVKQSIYRFRQARPDLFMGKYDSFTDVSMYASDSDKKSTLTGNIKGIQEQVAEEESVRQTAGEEILHEREPDDTCVETAANVIQECGKTATDAIGEPKSENVKVILNDNFRSRREVLAAVNEVFSRIMLKEAGGIEYDEAAALKYGALYYDDADNVAAKDVIRDVAQDVVNDDARDIANTVVKDDTSDIVKDIANDVANSVVYDVADDRVNDSVDDSDGLQESIITREINNSYKAELLVGIEDELSKQELQANIIADRIVKMINKGYQVYDTRLKSLRNIRYSDIVILVRSLKGWEETFRNVLSDKGIPLSVTSSEGYFNTIEVRTALSFLRVIDNPKQDIPLAAIMLSQMGDFTDEEIAIVRSSFSEGCLYDAVKAVHNMELIADKDTEMNPEGNAAQEQEPNQDEEQSLEALDQSHKLQDLGENSGYNQENGSDNKPLINESIMHKCVELVRKIEYYRQESAYTPVHKLLQEYVDMEYGDYVLSMEKGEQRYANLNMLIQKAVDYGKTSFKGLFNFVRYMELIRKYEIEDGEAGILGEQDNVVRIMTIHKSKGLEFPVCFIAGMEKKRNDADEKGDCIWDVKLGIGVNHVDLTRRVKAPTLYKAVVRDELARENIAEEMRVLYVAMTRAREKLIMVASHKDEEIFDSKKTEPMQAASYIDMIGIAAGAELNGLKHIDIRLISEEELVHEAVSDELIADNTRNELLKLIHEPDSFGETSDNILEDKITQVLSYRYPYIDDNPMPMKLSVSELKHKAIEELVERGEELAPDGERLFEETQPDKYIPKFMREEGETKKGGTFYGTAFHRILELWDYSKSDVTEEDIEEYVAKMQTLNQMDKESADAVRPRDIVSFLNADIGQRMYAAKQRGQLYREQPFVIGVKKSEIDSGLKESLIENHPQNDEIILVQGIIDAFMVEDDGIVILDYKTDYVTEADMLIKRYRPQLEYYGRALSQVMGVAVKDLIIYSSRLRQTISLV